MGMNDSNPAQQARVRFVDSQTDSEGDSQTRIRGGSDGNDCDHGKCQVSSNSLAKSSEESVNEEEIKELNTNEANFFTIVAGFGQNTCCCIRDANLSDYNK